MIGKLLILVLFVGTCATLSSKIYKEDEAWDFLLLAQFWPATSCYVYFSGFCGEIPKEVTGWTIHGLWPSKPGHEEPFYCNKTDKFDFTKIKSLSPQLAVQWPYYNSSADPTTLWTHEWEKHGTCASSVPDLKGELNYFTKTMQLQKPLNISGALAKKGIVPSSTVLYKPQDFFEAVNAEFGVVPNIACSYDHRTKLHHIEQVWLCMSKTFQFQNCPDVAMSLKSGRKPVFNKKTRKESHFSDCPQPYSQTVHYLPLRPENYEHGASVLRFKPEDKH